MGENNIQNKIEKKFLFYDTREAFTTDFNTGKIKDESIVFVKDDQTIWTHGQEFKANGNSLKLLIDRISTKVEQVNSATQQLIDNKITQVLANIDQSHTLALEDAAASLAQAKLDLDAVQERIDRLLASESRAHDYAISLEGIIRGYDEAIGEINEGIAELTAFVSTTNAKLGLVFSADNIATHSKTIYESIVDLIGQLIKQELKVIDTDQDVVNAVGRIMLSGFLQDYVTTTLLTDAGYLSLLALLLLSTENGTALASLAASVERLNEQVSSFVNVYASLDGLNELKDLLGGGTLQGFENILAAWLTAIEKDGILKGYLVQYLTSDSDVYTQLKTDVFSILNLEGSPVLQLDNRLNNLELAEGYTLTIGKINDLLDNSVLLSLNGITIKGSNGNKIQLVSKAGNEQFGGLRHWIDLNNNDSWYDTVTSGGKPYTELKTSNFELNVDGSGHVGRYTSYTYTENGLTTTEEAFPISWGTDGKVKIFADVIGDAQGNPIEWDTPSYKTEYIFTKINNSYIPSELSDLLPLYDQDPTNDGDYIKGYTIDDLSHSCTWLKTSISGSVGFSIFIALRENLVDKNGNITAKGTWQGPYQISGADGTNGTDNLGIHFIYYRTDTRTPQPNLIGVTSNSLSDWKEDASDSDVLIDKDHRFCWMAFSTEKNISGHWINFQGPILWSVWGELGIDGDGVEYIFCKTTDDKDWSTINDPNDLNPSAWPVSQDNEFILLRYKTNTPGAINMWYDDPLEMTSGDRQWVSKRTYTYNETVGKKQWGAYSVPSLWSYYAQDGVVSGYTVNIDNLSIALSVNSHGHLATEDEGDVPDVNHPIYWNIHKTDGTQPVYTSDIDNYPETISSSAPVYTIGYTAEAVPAASNSNAPSWHRVTIEGSGNNVYANLQLVSYFDVTTWDSLNPDTPYGDTGTDYSNLNLLNNNVKVTLTFTVYEAYDSSDHSNDVKYIFTKTFYVYGVYTGNDGEAGTTYDLKVSSVTVSKNRYSGAVSPSSITVWCLKTKGETFEKIYPSSTNNTSAIRFGYFRGNNAPNNPSIDDINIASLTTNSISTDDTLPIVVYMFAKQNGVYTMIDLLEITEVLSGENGAGTYVSTVFCRTSIDEAFGASPDTPTGGSYSTPIPNPAGVTYNNGSSVYPLVKNNGGSYGFDSGANQILWQDGIPEGDETLWESRCTFISTSPDIASWTTPRKVQDDIDWDVEFALEYAGGATPPDPTNENRHGGSGTQIWYDPELDKETVLPNNATWKDMVWRAERWILNGIETEWVITRIKGERGLPGEGYRLEASRTLVDFAYSKYGEPLLNSTDVLFTLYKNGLVTNDPWTLLASDNYIGASLVNKTVTISSVPENNGNLYVQQYLALDENDNLLAIVEITVCRRIVDDFEVNISTNKVVYNKHNNTYSPNVISIRLYLNNNITGNRTTVAFDNNPWTITTNSGLVINYSESNTLAQISIQGVSYSTILNGIHLEIKRGGTTMYLYDIAVEENNTQPGLPGKMFYMCGKYTEEPIPNPSGNGTVKTYYERSEEYIPLVYFHGQGEDTGSWYYLNADANYPDGSTYSNETRYAPEQYDKYDKMYTYNSGVWEKASQFNVIVTEGIFSEFAKLGSAIISGDFIISRYGLMYNYTNNTYEDFQDESYIYFSPSKNLYREGRVHYNTNPFGDSIFLPKSCVFEGTIKVEDGYDANLLKLVTVDEYGNSTGSEISMVTSNASYTTVVIGGTTYREYLISMQPVLYSRLVKTIWKGNNPDYINYRIEADIIHQIGLNKYGTFKPNLCINMLSGDFKLAGGVIRWDRGNFNQLKFYENTETALPGVVISTSDSNTPYNSVNIKSITTDGNCNINASCSSGNRSSIKVENGYVIDDNSTLKAYSSAIEMATHAVKGLNLVDAPFIKLSKQKNNTTENQIRVTSDEIVFSKDGETDIVLDYNTVQRLLALLT